MSEPTALTQEMIMDVCPSILVVKKIYITDIDSATETGIYGFTWQSCAGLPTNFKRDGRVEVYANLMSGEVTQILHPQTSWNGYIMLKRVKTKWSTGWNSWYGIKGEELT